MPNIAMLALEASDGTVVLTSITLVFAMLIVLALIITLEGKVFDSIAAKKNPPKEPRAPKAAAPRSQPPAGGSVAQAAALPVAQDGIPGEVIAAIAAAVACLEGETAVIRGIRRVPSARSAGRRGVWGDAGVAQNTTPFV